MRGRGRHWDDWDEHSLIRRDFRQDHGGGPEAPRHKKKAKKKRKRKDHKHEYVDVPYTYRWIDEPFHMYECKHCGRYNHKKTMYENRMRRNAR